MKTQPIFPLFLNLVPLYFLFFLFFLFFNGCGFQRTPPPEMEKSAPLTFTLNVDRSNLEVGDLFHLKFTVFQKKGVDLLEADPGRGITDFDIVEIKSHEPYQEGDLKVTGKTLKLQTRLSGSYQIPPFPILYQLGSQPIASLTSSQLWIEVKSPEKSASDTADIRGLKPHEIFYPPFKFSWFWLLSALGVILGFFLLRRIFKKEKIEVKIHIPEDQVALEKLGKIDPEESYLPQNRIPVMFEISEILRGYLTRRYESPVLEMTHEEIQESSLPGIMGGDHWSKTQTLLKFQERIRFAEEVVPIIEWTVHLEEIKNLIQLTKRKPLNLTSMGEEEDE